jgi:UV DNA damage endonuclease
MKSQAFVNDNLGSRAAGSCRGDPGTTECHGPPSRLCGQGARRGRAAVARHASARLGPHLRSSLEYLRAILDYLDRHDVRMYRMATALAPYASHPDLPRFHRQVEECADELAEVCALARQRGIRLSTHPGQYTVLNSEDAGVQRLAAAELEVQVALFNTMGLDDEVVVVLHVGGVAGGRDAGLARFCRGLELLPEQRGAG